MSFLRTLAERTLGTRPGLLPRLPSRYEPLPTGSIPPAEIEVAREAPRAAAPPLAVPVETATEVEPAPAERARRLVPSHREPPQSERENRMARRARSDDAAERAPVPPSSRRSTVAAHVAVPPERSDERSIPAAEPQPLRLLPLRPAAPQPSPARGRRPPAAEQPEHGERAQQPSVHIHIGRIEVRAVTESKPPPPRPSPGPSRLDAYLKGRSGGRR